MKQCKKCGNAYEERYASCPYCSGERQVVTAPLPQPGAFPGPTIPLDTVADVNLPGMDVTVAPGDVGDPFPKTVPGDGGITMPPTDAGHAQEPDGSDTKFGPTIPLFPGAGDGNHPEETFDPNAPGSPTLPVRGWMVVIKGKGFGKDFRIHDAANIIGRSERADINLTFDGYVSHESAIVTFDGRNNKFYISCHPFTKNNVYVNKNILLAPIELHDYDVVEIGETELVFRSFCSESFNY